MGEGRDAQIRISNAERNQAVSMLGVHLSSGRLELAEFEDRCGQALAARTRVEVELLFEDLPVPHPDLRSATPPAAPIQGAAPFAGSDTSSRQADELRSTPLSSAIETIAGLTFLLGLPAAIALGFILGIWWTFLPVIAMTILLSGFAELFKRPKPVKHDVW